jgi:hypothetical protein
MNLGANSKWGNVAIGEVFNEKKTPNYPIDSKSGLDIGDDAGMSAPGFRGTA